MYVRNSSHYILLNLSDMQAYFSVEQTVLKNVKFREKATIMPTQIPFRNKNNNNDKIVKNWKKEHVIVRIGFLASGDKKPPGRL